MFKRIWRALAGQIKYEFNVLCRRNAKINLPFTSRFKQ